MLPDVVIDRDHITIDGVRIDRKPACSPTQWLEYWEQEASEIGELQDKIASLEEEMKDLQRDFDAAAEDRDSALADVKKLEDKIEAIERILK